MPKDAQEARAFKLAIIAGAVEAMAAAGAPRSDMVWHFAMTVQVGAQQIEIFICFALTATPCFSKHERTACATLWVFHLFPTKCKKKGVACFIVNLQRCSI